MNNTSKQIREASISATLNDLDAVKALIDNGYPLDAKDGNSMSLLHHASSLELIQYLVGKGLNVNDVDIKGWSPLLLAVNRNNIPVAEFLLKNGANVMQRVKGSESTALHLAAESGFDELAAILLRNGADVNAVNQRGNTPTHRIVIGGQESNVLPLLLQNGANTSIKNGAGKTALDLAIEFNMVDFANLLRPKINSLVERDVKTFASNLKGAAWDKETLNINGGEFNPKECSNVAVALKLLSHLLENPSVCVNDVLGNPAFHHSFGQILEQPNPVIKVKHVEPVNPKAHSNTMRMP